MKLALVILADVGQQEMLNLVLPFWAEQPHEIFVLTHADAAVEVNPDTFRDKNNSDVNLLEYVGGHSEVLEALATDDQLSSFDAYLVVSTDAFPISDVSSCIPPDLLKQGGAAVAGQIIWNRHFVQLAHKHLSDATNLANPAGSWKPFVSKLVRETQAAVFPLLSTASATDGRLVSAALAVQSRSASIIADVQGPASLAFLLNALGATKPLDQKNDEKNTPEEKENKNAVAEKDRVEEKKGVEERGVERVLRSDGVPRHPTPSTEEKTAGEKKDEEKKAEEKAAEGKKADEVEMGGMTFVTALFDIRSKEGADRKICKTAHEYLKLGSQLLEWDVNLFIMVEPWMVTDVFQLRKRLGLQDKTFIYPLTIDQSRYHHLIHKLEKLYEKGRVPAQYWPPKDTPLYVWCMMQKADALRRAMDMNVFRSGKFFWIDFGIFHVAEQPRPSLQRLVDQLDSSNHDRIRCNMLRPIQPNETDDAEKFYSKLQQCFAGGFFGGKKKSMEWFIEDWEKEMNVATDHYPALDQAMFGRIYNRNRDRFLPIIGFQDGHRRLLQPRSHEHIMNELKWAVSSKQFDLARCLLQEIVPSICGAELWLDKHLQLAFLNLANQIDPNNPDILATIARIESGSTKKGEDKSADDKKDPRMDGETLGRVLAKLQGWQQTLTLSTNGGPDVALCRRVQEFVADFGSRLSVVDSLPCVNAMLELVCATKMASDKVYVPLKRVPVWVLNLDRRPDRWKQMQQCFSMLGKDRFDLFSEFKRFPAVDGSKQKEYLMSLPFWEKSKTLPVGAVACTASHMKMWQEWARLPPVDGQQWLQILEDDVTFSPSFMRDMGCLQHLWSQPALAKVYHTIWNGFHQHVPDRWNAVVSIEPIKLINLKENRWAQCIGGTFGYMISKNGARLALRLLEEQYNLPADTPIDVWFMRMVHQKIRHMSPQRAIVLSDFYIPGQFYQGDIADTSRHQKKQ